MLLLIALSLLLSSLNQIAAGAACGITLAKPYRYDCGLSGWIRNPTKADIYNGITTAEMCAERCLSQADCKSFKFVARTSKCYLYSKHLEEMSLDRKDYVEGKLFDGSCYSTDCETISVCGASEACHRVTGNFYNTPVYQQFACGYGVTDHPSNHTFEVSLGDGSWSACKAIHSCSKHHAEIGPFDVLFHIPSDTWLCIVYTGDHAGRYDYDLKDENISRTRFTVRNDSIGSAYGFWEKRGYDEPGRRRG